MRPCAIDYVGHSQPRPSPVDCDHRATRGKYAQLKSSYRRHAPSSVFQNKTDAPNAMHCASLRRVQSTVAFVECEWGRVSCMEPYRRVRVRLAKSTDRVVKRPTIWSKMFSPASLSHCGARTLRHRSQPSSGAACAPSSATWKARAIGQATRSQPSFQKFSNGIRCATSA